VVVVEVVVGCSVVVGVAVVVVVLGRVVVVGCSVVVGVAAVVVVLGRVVVVVLTGVSHRAAWAAMRRSACARGSAPRRAASSPATALISAQASAGVNAKAVTAPAPMSNPTTAIPDVIRLSM
jgi:hypothetical protein